jgi:formylglycine-generating enzyme required for sulfatase activity
MIERVIAILQSAGFDFTAKELADIFWLAVQMEPSPESSPSQTEKQPESPIIQQQDSPNQSSDIPKPQLPNIPATQERKAPISLPTSQSKTVKSTQSQEEAIPIKIPAATALRNALALGRALRPLMRKVPSFTEKILDEEATVYRFAEDKIGIPVLKSTPERWLELALVTEETSITEIWEPTIREFQRLLKHHGAFRDVRTWKLKATETSSQTKVQLFPQNSTGINESTPHNPNVLIDPKGRRLILLISDCISPIWRKKLIYPVLDLWGKRGLVTILQLLPERFWNRTALADEIPVLLSSLTAGVYNSRLIVELWDEDDIDDFADESPSEILSSLISIPVITLEPEPLLIWSKVIAGQGNISTAGFKFSLQKSAEISEQSPTTPHLSASDLVNRFRATASLQARQLAGLMAASPVSVSVVHLIQQTLLPDSTQIHVAEVFISGLLKRIPIFRQDNPDYITYEFIDGVRELLRDFVPSNKQISVIDKLSEFIAKALNLSRDKFEAQILKYQENDALEKQIRPFAELKAQVLRQLGGDYSLEAEKLEAINKISYLSSFFYQYTGEYACAVKWGGEAGIWQRESEPEHLLISSQGQVQFRSRFGLAVIQNLTVEGQTLSWSFDNNETAASITFKENSENTYFWEENQTGKLFEGWLNYPNEGRIDFRGRFVISDTPQFFEFTFQSATIILIDDSINTQTFNFEIAFVEINHSTQINNSNILEVVDTAVFNQTKQHLSEIEQALLDGTFKNLTYKQIYNQIVESANYSESEEYLRHRIGGQLWKVLTEIVGENVNKKNAKAIMNQWAVRSHLTIHRYSAEATGFVQDLGNDTQLEMMLIPGDTFVMGSPPEELEHRDYERPQHIVTVQPFFMGKYPVTQAQWKVVAALPQVNRELESDPSKFKGENRPVERVSWYEALEFCDRLSQHTGKSYRLPSEAEWEYACRTGTTTPFHFGETITSELANYNATQVYGRGVEGAYRQETTSVGSFGVANAFGLYDMHGNVLEWCLDDWHGSYEGAPTDGSPWFDNKNDNLYQKRKRAVLRGGSWIYSPGNCRSACRLNFSRDNHVNLIGFRIVCAAGRILE